MKNSILLLCLLVTLVANAQLPEYYVYLIKGDVTLKKGTAKPVKIKQKQLLYKTDVITLSPNAEVTLVNKEQENVVLTAAGPYVVSALNKKLHTSTTGVTKKYLNILWHELLDPHYDYSKLNNENMAATWGGVSRGETCDNLIFPINGLKTSQASIHFKWHRTSVNNTYHFLLYDGAGKEILNNAVSDTQTTVNAKDLFKNNGKYYWLVKGDGATCEDEVPLYFEIMSAEEEAKLVTSLVPPQVPADLAGQFAIIDKLEKNALIDAAAERLSALVKSNPNDPTLFKSYISFLLKYGFDDEARNEWKTAQLK